MECQALQVVFMVKTRQDANGGLGEYPILSIPGKLQVTGEKQNADIIRQTDWPDAV
jgi:hypothetical protein